MANVQLDEELLDDGVHVMYRDFGHRIRAAYDPRQISRAEALTLLCIRLPKLVGSLQLVGM